MEKEGEQRERERGQRGGRSEGGRGGKSKEGGGLEKGEGGGHHLVVTVNRIGLNLLSRVFRLNIQKCSLA